MIDIGLIKLQVKGQPFEVRFPSQEPPPPPPAPRKLMRLRNDTERRDMGYISRTLHPEWEGGPQTPEVIPFFLTPAYSSSGNRTPLASWKGFVWAINEITSADDRKWRYYINDHSGWFNKTGWDQLEALGMGDNLVNVLEEYRGFSRIETLTLEDGPPDPALVNYERTPWLVHRFTVITPRGEVVDPPPGRIYSPLVVKRLDPKKKPIQLWVTSEWLIDV